MAITNKLEVDGMSVNEVFDQVVSQGLSTADASILVSSWIFENLGKSKRVFNYATDFPAVDAACVASFLRSFQHTDWIDGESVVQAEQTTSEEGFNQRFHRIEADLDAVGRDAAKALTCLAEMRRGLRTLLDEIRAEINRINSDIHTCCNKGTVTPPVVDVFPNFGGLVSAGTFLGVSKFNEKEVSLWKTDQGIMMLPAVQTIGIDVVTSDRVRRAGTLARFIEENPAVRAAFGDQALTKKAFVDRFGNEMTKEGRMVRELVEILPDTTRFASLNSMLDALAEREAAAMRTTEGVSAAVAAVLGLETDASIGANASVDRITTIPMKVRGVLIRNGIDTVEKLSKTEPKKIAELIKEERIEASVGEIAEWTMLAKTLNQIR
jgi:hypothetical protein